MRWYFSFRSPYSWIAHRDLTTRHPDLADALDWVPFWEPDERSRRLLAEAGGRFPYADMSRAKHRYILQDVRRLARARGLAMAWPLDRDPCWEVAHLAYLVAAARGRGREFADAVYRERWERGGDIGDRATIAAVAAEVGLDPAGLADAVDDDGMRQRGLEVLLAIERDGVFGVPFFINGYEKFWGVDRLPDFVRSTGQGNPPRAEGDAVPAPVGPGADAGHAGGCG